MQFEPDQSGRFLKHLRGRPPNRPLFFFTRGGHDVPLEVLKKLKRAVGNRPLFVVTTLAAAIGEASFTASAIVR
jgi:hypothetical protein